MSEPRPHASQLPAEPDLRHLKDQAKDLLKCGKAPSLAAALLQIARLYGFPSWPKLKSHVIKRTNTGNFKQAISRDDLAHVRHLLSEYPRLRTAPIGYGGAGPLTWAGEQFSLPALRADRSRMRSRSVSRSMWSVGGPMPSGSSCQVPRHSRLARNTCSRAATAEHVDLQ